LGRVTGPGSAIARMALERGIVQVQAHGRKGREQRRGVKVPRLLRLRRADRPGSVASGAGGVSRAAVGNPGRQAGAARRAGAGQAINRRGQDRVAPGLEPSGSPGGRSAAQVRRLDLARQAVPCPRSATCSRACARRRRKWRSRSSPTTCATCCWQRPPGRAW
jgi:hypothetical protein